MSYTEIIGLCTLLLALWAIRSSSKDAARQIESIKKLAEIQIKTTQLLIDKELWEARARYLMAECKMGDMLELDHEFSLETGRHSEEKERELTHEKEYFLQYAHELEQYHKDLRELSKDTL